MDFDVEFKNTKIYAKLILKNWVLTTFWFSEINDYYGHPGYKIWFYDWVKFFNVKLRVLFDEINSTKNSLIIINF